MPTTDTALPRVKLDPDAVTAIFRNTDRSGIAINELYRLVHPEIDRVARFDGYPTCNTATWRAICELVMEIDRRRNAQLPYDKQFMAGGAWMNCGFSTHDGLGLALWEVIPVPADKIIFSP